MALAGLSWLLLHEEGNDPAVSAPSQATAGAATAPAAALGAARRASLTPAAPAPIRTEAAPERTDFRQPTAVFGRCLDVDGAPLSGCAVTVRVMRSVPETDPATYGSDGDGRFTVPVPHGIPLEVFVRAPGRVTRVAPLGRLGPGTRAELGEFVLRPGRTVLGTVRDKEDKPHEGVLVRLLRDPSVRELKFATRPLRVIEARSDARGGLFFPEPVLPGAWRVAAAVAGSVTPTHLTIDDVAGEFAFTVTFEHRNLHSQIAGVVRDERNGAVARAEVQAYHSGGDAGGKERVLARAVTATDGSFVLDVSRPIDGERATRAGRTNERSRRAEPEAAAPAPEPPPVRLRVLSIGCEFLPDERFHVWGTRGIDLRVRRSDAIAVRVSHRDTRPVENFALHVFPPRPNDLNDLRARSRGPHEDGMAYAYGVRAGRQVVWVDAGPGWATDGVRHLHHHGYGTQVDVVVDPSVRRRLRVVDRAGNPVAGATVELLLPLGDAPLHRFTPAAKLMDLCTKAGERALRVVSSFVDASGCIDVEGHPDTRYGLRIKSDRFALYFDEVVLAGLATVTDIQLREGARVDGVVQPLTFLTQLRDIGAKPPRAALVAHLDGQPVRFETAVDAHGRFVFEHMTGGDWQVELSWTTPIGSGQFDLSEFDAKTQLHHFDSKGVMHRVHARSQSKDVPVWAGTRTRERREVVGAIAALGEGETRAVSVRTEPHLHAVLRGRLDGADPSWVKRIRLVPVGSEGSDAAFQVDGGAYWVALEPGTYRLAASRHQAHSWPLEQVLTVLAGQTSHVNIVVDLCEVKLRVMTARADADRRIALRVINAKEEDVGTVAVNEKGEASAYLRGGRYRLRYGSSDLAEFAIEAGRTSPLVVEVKPDASTLRKD